MKRSLLLVVACLTGAQLLGASPAKPGFRAGAATSNVTPFLGGDIVGGFTLAVRYREPIIARRQVTAEQIAWAKLTLAQPASKSGTADLPRIYAGRTLRLAESPEAIPVPLQVFRIGPVCIGTMPTEVFCEIGLEFKKRSPLQPALLVSLSHGYLGYLPTPRHFALGGYETWTGTNQLEPQASEKMLDALLQMAAEIKK